MPNAVAPLKLESEIYTTTHDVVWTSGAPQRPQLTTKECVIVIDGEDTDFKVSFGHGELRRLWNLAWGDDFT